MGTYSNQTQIRRNLEEPFKGVVRTVFATKMNIEYFVCLPSPITCKVSMSINQDRYQQETSNQYQQSEYMDVFSTY